MKMIKFAKIETLPFTERFTSLKIKTTQNHILKTRILFQNKLLEGILGEIQGDIRSGKIRFKQKNTCRTSTAIVSLVGQILRFGVWDPDSGPVHELDGPLKFSASTSARPIQCTTMYSPLKPSEPPSQSGEACSICRFYIRPV